MAKASIHPIGRTEFVNSSPALTDQPIQVKLSCRRISIINRSQDHSAGCNTWCGVAVTRGLDQCWGRGGCTDGRQVIGANNRENRINLSRGIDTTTAIVGLKRKSILNSVDICE